MKSTQTDNQQYFRAFINEYNGNANICIMNLYQLKITKLNKINITNNK